MEKKVYSPASLPPITVVEVVILSDFDPSRVNEYMREAANTPGVAVSGEAAQIIAFLWRQLPPDETYRCHLPPYGLRFRSGEEIILQASICWQCNNIFGEVGDEEFAYHFNGEAPISKRLFAAIQQAVGHELDA